MLEFKRALDTAETLLRHEINSGGTTHTNFRGTESPGRGAGMGGGSFTSSRWTVFGQGKKWEKTMKTFGISAENGNGIIYRLGSLLLSEHEKLIGSH